MSNEYIIYTKKENDCSSDFFRITGLNASRGVCILSTIVSAVFVDSRYLLAANRILDKSRFELYELSFDNIKNWLVSHCNALDTVIYDWNIWTVDEIKRITVCSLKFVGKDLQNLCHEGHNGIIELGVELTGRNYKEKLENIRDVFTYSNVLLLTDSDSICWLLNIRGEYIKESLSIDGFALIHKSGHVVLYTNKCINNTSFCNKHIDSLLSDLSHLENVATDIRYLPCKLYESYKTFIFVDNPCINAKAIKNEVEIRNIRQIHIDDGVALTKFIYWLSNRFNVTEVDAANKLREFRKLSPKYIADSFSYISAADEHAAEIHFHGTAENNKKINGIYLFDTGAQYYGGTTDVTRTVCLCTPTKQQKEMYTRVLMGHIDLYLAHPDSDDLDQSARQYLRDVNVDYAHGTGHGVGYMLNVHEDGVYISGNIAKQMRLKEGMVLSNEPGYYEHGAYGIRLENMMYIARHNGKLVFKNLTLAPYCNELVCVNMLKKKHKIWLIDYYKEVVSVISPHIDASEQMWLQNYANELIEMLTV